MRLIYENRPLAGALVVAMNRLNPAEKLSARTDKDGRVRFKLRPGGMWLIKAVHMVPAPAGAHAEWASFWASLTFEMRNAAAVPVTDVLPRSTNARIRTVFVSSRRRGVRAAASLAPCRRRAARARAHELGTTRVSVLFNEGRTYDVEIVTDAAALVEKLDASSGAVAVGRPPSGSSPVRLAGFDETFRRRVKLAFDASEVRPAIAYAVSPGTDAAPSPIATIRLTGQIPPGARISPGATPGRSPPTP